MAGEHDDLHTEEMQTKINSGMRGMRSSTSHPAFWMYSSVSGFIPLAWFVSDLEIMFHHVVLPERDRNALRFLWLPDDNFDQDPQDFRMCAYLFGAMSSLDCVILM